MPTAIVTGGSAGFGRALAQHLAREGWHLVIDARHPQVLAATAESLRTFGAEVRAVPGDIADAEHREKLIEATTAFGRLDLLVNNASTLGPSPLPPLDALATIDLDRIFAVNVFAPLALVQLALPLLRTAMGTVVGISSDAAVEGYEGWGGYGSSKAALDQLLNVLASEEKDLHVYAFDPGDMRTAMHQQAFPGEDISDRPEPDTVVPLLVSLVESGLPSGRYSAAELARS